MEFSSGVLLPKTLESFSNLGLVDHIARAIQRWNYCQVHELLTCSSYLHTEFFTNQVEFLEFVLQTQLSPYKLSGYRLTTNFIDVNTQDIFCRKMHTTRVIRQ